MKTVESVQIQAEVLDVYFVRLAADDDFVYQTTVQSCGGDSILLELFAFKLETVGYAVYNFEVCSDDNTGYFSRLA